MGSEGLNEKDDQRGSSGSEGSVSVARERCGPEALQLSTGVSVASSNMRWTHVRMRWVERWHMKSSLEEDCTGEWSKSNK